MRCWSAAGVRPPRPQANQVFQGLDLPPSPERALTAPPKGSSQHPRKGAHSSPWTSWLCC